MAYLTDKDFKKIPVKKTKYLTDADFGIKQPKKPKKKSLWEQYKAFNLEQGGRVLAAGDKIGKAIGDYVTDVPLGTKIKDIGETPGAIQKGLISGGIKGFQNIGDFINEKAVLPTLAAASPKYTYSDLLKKYGKAVSTREQTSQTPQAKYIRDVAKQQSKDTGISKFGYQLGEMVAPTVLAAGVSAGTTALTGNPLAGAVAGRTVFGTSAFQSYKQQAVQEGKSEVEANLYALPMAVAETYLEKLGYNPFKAAKSQIIKSAGGEFIEEAAMPWIDAAVRKIGFGENKKVSDIAKQSLIDGAMGALLGGIMDISTSTIGRTGRAIQQVANKQRNGVQVTTAEIQQAVQEIERVQPGFTERTLSNFTNNVEQAQTQVETPITSPTTTETPQTGINIPKQTNVREAVLNSANIEQQQTTPIIQEIITNEQQLNDIKKQQLDIIKKENPAPNDNLVWVRSESDIKTPQETFNLQEFEQIYPDFDETQAQQVLETGKITVYSSQPIKNGVFVSPSKMMAQDYAGGKQIYEKTIDASDVAWLNTEEGQYAKVQPTPIKPTTKTPKAEAKVEEQKKVAKLLNEVPEVKVDKSIPKELDKVAQQIINKGHFVDKLAKETGNKELTFKYDKTLSADAEGQYVVGQFQTDNNGKKIGKSVVKIWEPIEKANMVEPFSDYLLHKHNIDRATQEKPVFGEEVTADMSRQAVKDYEAKYPQFKEWSNDINKFNKNQLRNMTEAGLTSVKAEKLLNDMYGNYVRIQREQTGTSPITVNNGRIAIKSPIQKAKGGTSDILPLKETMAQQAIMIKRAIRRNDLGLELLKELGGRKQGEAVDLNKIVDKTDDGYTMTVFENGEPTIIDINEGLYDSLKPRDRYDWEDNLLARGVQKAARIQRSVLTVDNPFFIATNFFKDIQDAPFNSKHPLKFVPNYLRAVKEIKSNGKLWQLYQANGGNQNTYFDYDMKLTKEPKGAMKWVEKIRSVNEAVEQAPRLAEFISTIQDGKSITEAMYNAAEITTNFNRGGDITKALNRNGANFLNASIQGFEKQFRNIKGANGVKGYVSLLAKATVLGIAPAILNALLLGDDDDYKDLPADTKDRFYLFKTGDNKFVKIPKGRVISIFGMVARRTLEKGQGNKEAYDGQWRTFINQLAPNNPLEDNVLAPIIQAKTNRAWYGGEIVPQRLQKFSPKNQYDETTDSFSKFISKTLSDVGINVSAKKVNYVVDQYSGGIGDILLPLGTPRAETNPLSAKFTVNSIITNKNSAQFYDTKERLTQKVNDGDASVRQQLGLKYLNSIQSQLNNLYKEKREIELSDKADKIKRKEVQDIQNQINGIMRKSLTEYNNAKKDGSYMRVGDMYFQKKLNTKTGEWEWKKDT